VSALYDGIQTEIKRKKTMKPKQYRYRDAGRPLRPDEEAQFILLIVLASTCTITAITLATRHWSHIAELMKIVFGVK